MKNIEYDHPVFTAKAFQALSRAATADPADYHEFLDACEAAGVLDAVVEAHGLVPVISMTVQEEFDAVLDEHHEPVCIARYYFDPSEVLKRLDNIAYREELRAYTDARYTEVARGLFEKQELDALTPADVVSALAAHCADHYELSEEEADELHLSRTPQQFVAALKRLCLSYRAPLARSAGASEPPVM